MRPSTWSRDRKIPPLGITIYDENAQQIGKISDIIGPVFKPYFKIKPSRPNLSTSSFKSLIGEPLYTLSDSRGKNLSNKGKFKEKFKKGGVSAGEAKGFRNAFGVERSLHLSLSQGGT